MKIEKALIAIFITVLLVSGCKKEDEKTKMDLLTQHTWIMTSATVDPSLPIVDNQGNIIGYTDNLYDLMEECDHDNTVTYSSDGKVTYDQGANKCDPDDPQSMVYDWAFNTDETKITEIDGQGNTVSSIILKLDEHSLTQSVIQAIQNINYTITMSKEPI